MGDEKKKAVPSTGGKGDKQIVMENTTQIKDKSINLSTEEPKEKTTKKESSDK